MLARINTQYKSQKPLKLPKKWIIFTLKAEPISSFINENKALEQIEKPCKQWQVVR